MDRIDLGKAIGNIEGQLKIVVPAVTNTNRILEDMRADCVNHATRLTALETERDSKKFNKRYTYAAIGLIISCLGLILAII